ncbi:MAG: hypothetical protein CL916_06060, partial [Deltaproteobacteria bacterium]|nr:hypothetical protein [Deltaproteobacteria bacterium]
ALENGNREILSVLTKIVPPKSLPEKSMILLHTACNTLLIGLARWIKKINRPDLKIRIVLRWPATRRVFDRTHAEIFCAKACSIYPKLRGDIRFYSDNKGLVEYYQKLTGLHFEQTPIGIQFQDIPELPPPDLEVDHLRYVFAGVPRKEKGIDHIAHCLPTYTSHYPLDQFFIHTINAYNFAKKLRREHPEHVFTHNEFLTGRPYFDFLLLGDVVLIPYDIKSYELRTSHIFMEALGLGRAVIVSKGSWMEEVLQEIDIPLGIVMNSWTSQGIFNAMVEMHQRRNEILTNAYQYAATIRDTHNPIRWMELMFASKS